jgi:hypothetical protein
MFLERLYPPMCLTVRAAAKILLEAEVPGEHLLLLRRAMVGTHHGAGARPVLLKGSWPIAVCNTLDVWWTTQTTLQRSCVGFLLLSLLSCSHDLLGSQYLYAWKMLSNAYSFTFAQAQLYPRRERTRVLNAST